MGKKLVGALVLGLAMSLVLPLPHASAAALMRPDPALSFLPSSAVIDWAAVHQARSQKATARAQRRSATVAPPAIVHNEREAAGAHGVNDKPTSAERIAGFGTRKGKNNRVTITGDLARDPAAPTLPAFGEDNGSIPLAGDTGVGTTYRKVTTSGVVGDGPHGRKGDATGDFDFYQLNGGPDGKRIKVNTYTPNSELDTFLVLYNAAGQGLVFSDNTPGSTDSELNVPLTANQDYYVLVFAGGWGMLPKDPMDSGSGNGVGTEGSYDLVISNGEADFDRDYFSVDLRAGDVLGASVAGEGKRLAVHDATGREVFGSTQDGSGLYSPDSPLPGGGNAVVDFVAPVDGRYSVGVQLGEGRYEVTLEAYRPGTETQARGTVQTLFLDFDGARVNTAIFGGPGVRQLSPFANFLAQWELKPADKNAVIDAVVATVRENVAKDLALKGTNPNFAVRILNSRDNADPFGQPNVTRLIVGGTVAESGIDTIGIAQSIDPGNYGQEETALILLDYLGMPKGFGSSLNTYLTPASNRVKFVGQAIGNVVAHELGHLSGNWHLDQFNDVASLMDQGGNPAVMFGVGPDGVGGTADDVDVDFTEDVLNPFEGFTGVEDTLNRTAWAYSRGSA